MNFPVFLEYSGWLLIPILILAAAIAAMLYWRNKALPYPLWLKGLLAVLRFVVIFVLALLLLKPYLLQQVKNVEPPMIVLAHDNSASIVSADDSVYFKNSYLDKLDSVYKQISNDFLIDTLLFGQAVSQASMPRFNENQTNISVVFPHLRKSYFRRNLGAVVLFSDGIYNAGFQPELAAVDFPYKTHVVALGDTVMYPDLAVLDIRYNRKVLKGSVFPVEVTIIAQNAIRKNVMVSLWKDDEKIGEQNLMPGSNRYSGTVSFLAEAGEAGFKNMEVRIEHLDDEYNTTNNVKQFFVEVIEKKQSILVLAKAPHPDLGAIQAALGDQYELEIQYSATKLEAEAPVYDLLIMHQMPDAAVSIRSLQNFLANRAQLPVLWIIGQNTDLRVFNDLQQFCRINPASDGMIQSNAVFNKNFTSFNADDQLSEQLNQWPPLHLPYADMDVLSQAEMLFFQKIRGVETNRPLIFFSRDEDRKTGLIFGTGLWNWRMHDFKNNQSHFHFDKLIQQLIRYVALANDNSLLKVNAEATYSSGSPVLIKAEVRNKSGELVQNIPLEAQLINEQNGRAYVFELIQNPPFYTLNAGHLSEGVYTYKVSGALGDEKLEARGRFIVENSSIENSTLVANWKLLQHISTETGGNFYTALEMEQLINDLASDESLVSVARFENFFDALINIRLLFGLLTGLLAIEWFLRKFYGSY
ncbi:MAG: hypothetical protein PHG67_12605 [Bacteroidales bacterium]|jgi:hypothetical protein|nr:hypothetical protein [Bacteroidales bacterium]HOI31285.1 hypothetical protein [Bacteroidales bacterium]